MMPGFAPMEPRTFMGLLADISLLLSQTDGATCDTAIREALARVGRSITANRCAIFLRSAHAAPATAIQEWTAEETPWSCQLNGNCLLQSPLPSFPGQPDQSAVTLMRCPAKSRQQSPLQTGRPGESEPCGLLVAPLIGSAGTFGHLVCHMRDVARIKATELSLCTVFAALLAKAIECRELTAQLAASRSISHDFGGNAANLLEPDRLAIARDIHDDVGQLLTALQLDLSLIQLKIGEPNTGVMSRLAAARQHIDETRHSLIRTVKGLRSPGPKASGLYRAMEQQLESLAERTGIRCQLAAEEILDVSDETRAAHLFRIVQESLTNILRHAEATAVTVFLQRHGDDAVLSIVDNGKGIGPEEAYSQNSYGLQGIRERARLCGGEAAISPARNGGTVVTVTIPLHCEKEEI